MKNYLMEILECPWCQGIFDWKINEVNDDRIVETVIICNDCSTNYLIHEGIGKFS